MTLTPCLDVFRNRRTCDFVIVNLAVHKRFPYAVVVGEAIHLSPREMQDRGLEVVMRGLDGFPDRDSDQGSPLDTMPPERHARFDSEHQLVAVSWEVPSRLTLYPCGNLGAGTSERATRYHLICPRRQRPSARRCCGRSSWRRERK